MASFLPENISTLKLNNQAISSLIKYKKLTGIFNNYSQHTHIWSSLTTKLVMPINQDIEFLPWMNGSHANLFRILSLKSLFLQEASVIFITVNLWAILIKRNKIIWLNVISIKEINVIPAACRFFFFKTWNHCIRNQSVLINYYKIILIQQSQESKNMIIFLHWNKESKMVAPPRPSNQSFFFIILFNFLLF